MLLALLDADEAMPWDIRRDQAIYTAKLAHVSARCRLSESDERKALELCYDFDAKLKALKAMMNDPTLKLKKDETWQSAPLRMVVEARTRLRSDKRFTTDKQVQRPPFPFRATRLPPFCSCNKFPSHLRQLTSPLSAATTSFSSI